MNHLDLFSGIGGFSLGLKQAGIEPDWIGYSDIDKHANQLFKRRFPNAKELGSITTIQPDKLPKIDLITFGFPCQDLSIAGKRGGLAANRSSLFFEAIKIIQHKKPKYFIFENVKGIFSSNRGKDFDIVLRSIADIGYDGQWELCNTRWYLPQNRERVYFVGHIRGESRPKVFPLTKDDRKIKDNGERKKIQIADFRNDEGLRIRKDGVLPCLARRKHSETDISTMPPIILDTGNTQAVEVYDYRVDEGLRIRKNNSSPTLTSSMGTGGWNVPMIKSAALRTWPRNSGMSDNEKSERGKRLEIREDDTANTITSHQLDSLLFQNCNIRRLTPTECERLQGFPDGWTEGQSDTQRYKQLGNAVSVPVVKAIMERLYKGESNAK